MPANKPGSDSVSPEHSSEAQAVAEEFKDYAYTVAHDLSGPARSMVEFSKLLTSEHAGDLSDEALEYLSIIIENGVKLAQMMDALIDYSRLNTTAKPFSRVHCDRLLADCREILKDKIDQTGATLEIGTLPDVQADAHQLKQLFLLLLDNAFKFHEAGRSPVIHVSAVTDKDGIRFCISDNGIGIEPEFHERIFKLFCRLQSGNENSGTGIGLALAKKIIHRHHGSIWCESVPNKGTSIFFTLPAPN